MYINIFKKYDTTIIKNDDSLLCYDVIIKHNNRAPILLKGKECSIIDGLNIRYLIQTKFSNAAQQKQRSEAFVH